MKKKRLIMIGTIAGAAALLAWAIPVAAGLAQAKPLLGSFMLARCVCGHDIFYLIEETQAFDYCPGHKEKKLIGPVTRAGNLVRVARARDSAPVFELKLEKGGYFLKFSSLKDDDWDAVDQITNPWRTSLRSYFPE